MKIVQVEEFFHPLAGYQINVLSKYLAKFNNEITIITGEIDKADPNLLCFFGKDNIKEEDKIYSEKYNIKIIRVPIKKVISHRAVFDKSIFNIINSENPDVVFMHDNDKLITIQSILKKRKINVPIITDCHMLLMASRNSMAKLFRFFYRTFVTPKIIKNNITVIKTQDDDYANKYLKIPEYLTPYISFGTDRSLFYPDSLKRNEGRIKLKIPSDDFVFVYAGKLDETKGGLLLANSLENSFSKKNITFLIVGNCPADQSIIEDIFKKSKNKIIRVGTQKYEDLAQYYQIADACIFPKQCSLSFFDAQSCGLIVLSEENIINIERNSHNNGLCFKQNSIESLRQQIEKIINMDAGTIQSMKNSSIQYIIQNFDYKDKAKEYLDYIRQASK